MKIISLLRIIAFSVISVSAQAAEVKVVKNDWKKDVIEIQGEIKSGDLIKIQRTTYEIIAKWPPFSPDELTYFINTPGGNIDEAIKIGRFFREILANVNSYGKIIISPGSEEERILIKLNEPWKNYDYVILSAESQITKDHIVANYSAGLLIFYGAVKRAHRDNSDQRLGFYKQRSIPVMGIHRPYYEPEYYAKLNPSQAAQAYKVLEKSVREYLLEMGAPQDILDRMFNKASNEIELIPAEEFRKFYKPQESFLEEWVMAKCGANGEKNVFQGDELEKYYAINKEQITKRVADPDSLKKPFRFVYPSNEYSEEEIRLMYDKVFRHNVRVNTCKETAISNHQREWAKKFTSKAK